MGVEAAAQEEVVVMDDPITGEIVQDASGVVVEGGEEGAEAVEGEGEDEEPDFSGTFKVYVKGKLEELEFDKLGYSWSEDCFLVNRLGKIQNRDPVTGQYMGRIARDKRDERGERVRANAYEGREARQAREAREARAAREEYRPDRPEYQEDYELEEQADPKSDSAFWGQANARASVDPMKAMPTVMDDPWAKIDFDKYTAEPTYTENEFVEPEINYEPGFGNKFATTDVKEAAQEDIEAELAEEEEMLKCEDGDEDCEEKPPKLKKEAYMTKDFYMPGYVDKTPAKEYPPHIQMFKNYIKTIGEFDKHGYESKDYSPDTSEFAPDSSGFGPDSESFVPNTSEGFGPKIHRPRVGGHGSSF